MDSKRSTQIRFSALMQSTQRGYKLPEGVCDDGLSLVYHGCPVYGFFPVNWDPIANLEGLMTVGLAWAIPEDLLDPSKEDEVIALLMILFADPVDRKQAYVYWCHMVGVPVNPDAVRYGGMR